MDAPCELGDGCNPCWPIECVSREASTDPDEEYAESVKKLSDIVAFVDQFSQADTSDVVPMAHPLDAAQRLRPDAATEDVERDYYQENAAATADGHYLVPKVIE